MCPQGPITATDVPLITSYKSLGTSLIRTCVKGLLVDQFFPKSMKGKQTGTCISTKNLTPLQP